ncbi:MAG: RHS repeat-associated core domain-containing protein [Chloroflexi bacterium]|nr:RHS repeat-associated core domain-containing protein [Chloroflexota bacterium]
MPTDIGHTGQRLDASTGLMFYGARYYDSALARFVSADTVVPGAGNPQALNRYSYVLGNPLKYTDPSGHRQTCDGGDCGDPCQLDNSCTPPGDQGPPNGGGPLPPSGNPIPPGGSTTSPPVLSNGEPKETTIGASSARRRVISGQAVFSFVSGSTAQMDEVPCMVPMFCVSRLLWAPSTIQEDKLDYSLQVELLDNGDPNGSWSVRFLSEQFVGDVMVDRQIGLTTYDIFRNSEVEVARLRAVRGQNNGGGTSLLPADPTITVLRAPLQGGNGPFPCCGSPGGLNITLYSAVHNTEGSALRRSYGTLRINLR